MIDSHQVIKMYLSELVSSQQRSQVLSERTEDNRKFTLTVLRGDSLFSYRTLGHTPGGINETMIESFPLCAARKTMFKLCRSKFPERFQCPCKGKINP